MTNSPPCVRLRRSSASRRKPGASIRSASFRLLKKKVNESFVRVEADNVRRVRDEVRERVDVVVKNVAVAVVHDVLDAAEVEPRGRRDSFDSFYNFRRRRVSFNLEPRLRRVRQTDFADGDGLRVLHPAYLRGAEVEALARRVDFDRVEVLAAERFDARDVAAARGDELLQERGRVDA